MTPFMVQVAELVGAQDDVEPVAPMPMTRISQRIATGTGADRHFADGTAYARLVGDGFESEIPQGLDGPDALPDLLVRLLVESGITRHPAA